MPINSTETNKVQFENAVFLPEIVKMLNEGHTVTLTLRGNSMRPFLEDCRDKALFVKPTTIAVGDPVLAEIAPKHFVLHCSHQWRSRYTVRRRQSIDGTLPKERYCGGCNRLLQKRTDHLRPHQWLEMALLQLCMDRLAPHTTLSVRYLPKDMDSTFRSHLNRIIQ